MERGSHLATAGLAGPLGGILNQVTVGYSALSATIGWSSWPTPQLRLHPLHLNGTIAWYFYWKPTVAYFWWINLSHERSNTSPKNDYLMYDYPALILQEGLGWIIISKVYCVPPTYAPSGRSWTSATESYLCYWVIFTTHLQQVQLAIFKNGRLSFLLEKNILAITKNNDVPKLEQSSNLGKCGRNLRNVKACWQSRL